MDKETYEKQKAFAGEKKPSMNRRMIDHDYQERQMYMITMVTEGRRPLFGRVAGRSDGAAGTPDEPHVVLTDLGQRVSQNWHDIGVRYPQISIIALQMMPDHFHGILFVREYLDRPLGKVLLGFKQGCNKAFRELVPSVAVLQQQTQLANGDCATASSLPAAITTSYSCAKASSTLGSATSPTTRAAC